MKVKKLVSEATIPTKAYETDAGFDLYCIKEITMQALDPKDYSWPITNNTRPSIIHTGIALEIPDGKFGMIKERSSLALMGMKILGGIIDSGYRGEIIVIAYNFSAHVIRFFPNQKVAQLLILPCYLAKIEVVEELLDSERGAKGFGSSDKQLLDEVRFEIANKEAGDR